MSKEEILELLKFWRKRFHKAKTDPPKGTPFGWIDVFVSHKDIEALIIVIKILEDIDEEFFEECLHKVGLTKKK